MKKLLFLILLFSRFAFAQDQVPLTIKAGNYSVKAVYGSSGNSVRATSVITNFTQGLLNGEFTLTIDTALSRVSVAVYNSSASLVKTIGSNINLKELPVKNGKYVYSGQWDGYLDDGVTPAPFGSYTLKYLSNDVKYRWLGVIGNSSTSHLQNEFLIGNGVAGLSATNDFVYVCGGYAERDITTNKFKSSDIGSMYHVIPGSQSLAALTSCTNSKYVFYGGNDFYGTANKGVFVIDPATDEEIIFDNGRAYNIAIDDRLYKSMLGFADDSNPGDAGRLISVSASDDFLFIAYQGGNLKVVDLRNKSGAVLSTTNISGLGRLAYGNGKLWVIVNGTPKCYSVSSSGTLTDDNLTIPNVSADNLAYNAFKNELVLSDVTTQTYQFYDNNSGNYKSVLGQKGGYLTNGPAVTNDKFCFIGSRGDRDALFVSNTAFTFLPNGTFWIADNGNYRMLHFDANHNYLETISYVVSSRSCAVDINNPTRVFADALEYQVDYSKVASDINSSWKLVNNWGALIKYDLDVYAQFGVVATLKNGHTYMTAGNQNAVYDLLPSNPVKVGTAYGNIEPDGSLWTREFNNSGLTYIKKAALTGFASNGMPLWGAPSLVVTTPTFSTNPDQPVFYNNNTLGASTNTGRYFFYNQMKNAIFDGITTANGYHLGAIKTGSNKWDWQGAKTLPGSYSGTYPDDGSFDYSGTSRDCLANVQGSNVLFHTNDELGRFTQVCYTNHFDEEGQLIGHFGTDNQRVSYDGDGRFYAGNSFKTQLTPSINGKMYYLWCDEGKHGGIGIVEISNLSSISKQSLPLTVSAAITPVASDPSDLMASLKLNATDLTGATGWKIETGNPAIRTTVQQYKKEKNDILIVGSTGDREVSRYLANQPSANYSLSGWVNFGYSQFTFDDFNVFNVAGIADQNGKYIALFYSKSSGIYLNNTKIADYSPADHSLYRHFSFDYADGVLSFQFGSYPKVTVPGLWDSDAKKNYPGYFKNTQHVIYYRADQTQLDAYGLKFTSANSFAY